MAKPSQLASDSASLTNCVSMCLIALLVFTTVVVFTLIAFNPIVILTIAETNSGQRDFIIRPKSPHLNSTKISEVSSFKSMPRVVTDLVLNESKKANGVFLDFDLEEEQHLGTFGEAE